MKRKFYITHLYPQEMSIYGDMGNILAIKYRVSEYGFEPVYQTVELGQELPEITDFYFIGGGQDRDQLEVFRDLQNKKKRLLEDTKDGVSLLAICGGYQLLGRKFVTGEGDLIDGIGLFDIETKSPDSSVKSRCIGNLVVRSMLTDVDTLLVGFENHGGQTKLLQSKTCKPLGKVVVGYGNNANKVYEGCVYKNAIGTYMHGSFLPKNPEVSDYFIARSSRRKAEKNQINPQFYLKVLNTKLDDTIELATKTELVERFCERI